MVDLYCGRFGWGKGFAANGWRVRGYDLKRPAVIPDGCEFVQADILSLILADIADADFVCCSSPCEEFSVHCMKHFHPNPPFPAKGIELFERGRLLCGDKPHVMENVRCAERFVGRSVNHCGPFYFWGDGVPATFPREAFALQKGMHIGSGQQMRSMSRDEIRAYRKQYDILQASSRSAERKEMTSRFAEIPLSLSSYIAQCATRLVCVG